MLHTKNHKVVPLFDPWEFLGPKRRKLMEQSWAGVFRQHILTELPVSQLKPFFASDVGRPTKELYSIIGALVLQQMHDLSDEQTVSQVAFNQQWHYALDITDASDHSTYLCEKTLWNFRSIMVRNGLDICVFNQTAEKLAQVFDVDTHKQRLDSVHIKSNMRNLGRIGIFTKSIHKFLVNVQRQHRERLHHIDSDIVDRYLSKKALECFSMVKPSESAATLAQVSLDLYTLVEQFGTDQQVRGMHSFKLLERVLTEQCTLHSPAQGEESTAVQLKPTRDISSDTLQNPSDPDAGYCAHKGKGYKVQVMETYSEETDPEKKSQQLDLITHVAVESAHHHDTHALLPAIQSTQARDLGPTQVLCDAHYGSDDNCRNAKQSGVDILSPAMGSATKPYGLASFTFGARGETVCCSQGNTPIKVRTRANRYMALFNSDHCSNCPFVSQCMVRQGKRGYYLNYTDKEQRCVQRRKHELTAAFRDRYRWRAGVEATMSAYDRLTGVKQLRVRGLPAVRFAAVLKAVAVNIIRATAVARARNQHNGAGPQPNPACKRLLGLFKELFMTCQIKIAGFLMARSNVFGYRPNFTV